MLTPQSGVWDPAQICAMPDDATATAEVHAKSHTSTVAALTLMSSSGARNLPQEYKIPPLPALTVLMILVSSLSPLLQVFGLLLLCSAHPAFAAPLLQPNITWPDVRDLEVISDPTPFVALRVQWKTQARDSLRFFEVTLRCTDSDRNDTRSSTTEAKVEYYHNLCQKTYVVEAFLQTAFNEEGMRVTRTMSKAASVSETKIASKSAEDVQPPTNATATLFIYPNQSVSLNISFVPPSLESAHTKGVVVENITLIVTSETNSPSELCREVLKKNENFGNAYQNAGVMEVKLPPVFKLGEIYKLVMYSNDVKEKSSEAKIIMPTFEPRKIASATIKSISATNIDFEWREPIFLIDDLKGFIMRGTNDSGAATMEVAPNYRTGRLSNLKPYTNYTTSITPLYSDDNSSNLTIDIGVVQTWSAAPSPPTLTSVDVSGPNSIMLSWKAPETTNGILEEYDAQCYGPGSDWPSGSQRVNAQTLSIEVTGLVPNTLYECAVIASTKQINWGQGGGRTPSARWAPIRTWPGTADQPSIKNGTALGPTSLFMEWRKPNAIYGVLGHYRVRCSPTGQTNGEKETQVPSDTLTATISELTPNTEYKCTVEVFVEPNEQNQGGGYSPASYPKILTTWSDAPSAPTVVTAHAVNSTAVEVKWGAPVTPNGEIAKYRVLIHDTVDGPIIQSFEVPPGVFSFVLGGLQPFTTVHLAVQADTKPNKNGLGGGVGTLSSRVSVTSNEAAPGPVGDLKCPQTPLGSPRLACSWSSPLLPNGIVRKYTVQLMDATSDHTIKSIETMKPSVTLEEQIDFTHDYQVSVAAVTIVEGEKTQLKVHLQTSKLPEGSIDKLTSRLTSPEFTKPVLDPSTQFPLFLSLEDIKFTEYSPITAISIFVTAKENSRSTQAVKGKLEGTTYYDHIYNGAQSWEVLVQQRSASVSQAIPNLHFVLGTDDGTVRPDHTFNGPLKPGSNYDVSVRLYTSAGYVATKSVKIQTQPVATTTPSVNLADEQFPPAAIAVTVCGVISLVALVIGITILMLRRRRTNAFIVDIDVEEDNKSVY